jgi:hypothetical protein
VGKLTISHRYNLRALAAIKPWGDSEGAGRIGLSRIFGRKGKRIFLLLKKKIRNSSAMVFFNIFTTRITLVCCHYKREAL